MKKFLQLVGELKSWICLSFTASLLIYLTVDFIILCCSGPVSEGEKFWGNYTHWAVFMDHKIKIGLIFQLFVLCACIGVLQYIFFSGKVLKTLSYNLRMAVFGVLCFGMCVGFAAACQWFALDNLGHWLTFIVIFLVAYVGISLGFELYFRVLGQKYDEALGRRQKESENDKSMNKP